MMIFVRRKFEIYWNFEKLINEIHFPLYNKYIKMKLFRLIEISVYFQRNDPKISRRFMAITGRGYISSKTHPRQIITLLLMIKIKYQGWYDLRFTPNRCRKSHISKLNTLWYYFPYYISI